MSLGLGKCFKKKNCSAYYSSYYLLLMKSLSEVHAVVVVVYHYFLSSPVYSSAVAPSGPDKRYHAEITGPHETNIVNAVLLLLLF